MNRKYFTTVFIVMLLLLVTPLLAAPESLTQQVTKPKRVVVLYWYDKNFVGHVRWDQGFQSALDAAPKGSIEYYPEYLEANRFPGANQSQILQNYLKQKYADLPPDVVVAQSEVSLDFLIKYKEDLFTQAPGPGPLRLEPGPISPAWLFMEVSRKLLTQHWLFNLRLSRYL